MWYLLLVSITCSPWQCWASPAAEEEYLGWNQLKPIVLFKFISVVSCSVFILCAKLSHVYAYSPCWSREHSPSFQDLGRKIWSTQYGESVDWLNWHSCWSKMKVTLRSHLCWDEVSSVCSSCGQSHSALLPELQGRSPLPISSEVSSIIRLPVTALYIQNYL